MFKPIFFKKKIPSFRHKKTIRILDNFFIKKSIKKKKNNLLTIKKKKIYDSRTIMLTSKFYKFNKLITYKPTFLTKPFKKIIIAKSLFNFTFYIPGLQYLNPGKVLINPHTILSDPFKLYNRGVAMLLYLIPITSYISNISNKQNKKITYAKAGGTFCKTQVSKKDKKKLVYIKLPSQSVIYLPKTSYGFIGKNSDFRIFKLIEGSWGYSFYNKKHIHVRGVAKNPVDHPNGGRTKTVQPERSP